MFKKVLLIFLTLQKLCVTLDKETYTVAFYEYAPKGLNEFLHHLKDFSIINVDILVLPSIYCQKCEDGQFFKIISDVAKRNKLYVVSSCAEKLEEKRFETECSKTSLVIDDQGIVIEKYDNKMEYTTTKSGVKLLVISDEELFLLHPDKLGTSNIIVIGDSTNMPFITKHQYLSALSRMAEINIVTETTVYSSNSLSETKRNGLILAELLKNWKDGSVKNSDQVITNTIASDKLIEDFILYGNKKEFDFKAIKGDNEITVCHSNLCCNFYASYDHIVSDGSKTKHKYIVMAFDGMRRFGKNLVALQTCAIFATSDKRTESNKIKSNAEVLSLKMITIRGNFTSEKSKLYPVASSLPCKKSTVKLTFDRSENSTAVTLSDSYGLTAFALINRAYMKDKTEHTSMFNSSEYVLPDVYRYVCNEELIEFFDSLWIFIRVPLIVISIYVLEMI